MTLPASVAELAIHSATDLARHTNRRPATITRYNNRLDHKSITQREQNLQTSCELSINEQKFPTRLFEHFFHTKKTDTILFTFLVPSEAERTSFKDNAPNSACSLIILLKSLFRPIYKNGNQICIASGNTKSSEQKRQRKKPSSSSTSFAHISSL